MGIRQGPPSSARRRTFRETRGGETNSGRLPLPAAIAYSAGMAWFVYVLVSDRAARTYVGVTVDPDRRLAQHNGSRAGGAKATRAGRPWRLGATFGPFRSRSEAQRAEWEIKSRPGRERLGHPVAGSG